MKIQCIDQNVEYILNSHYFEIPRFQRPYSWERDNWEEFWNDIFLSKQKDYFIGSVVTYANGPNKAIVDGQQRFTTITIILAALRNMYRKYGFEDRAKGTQNYIERNNRNYQPTFVLQTVTSYPYLQRVIQSYSQSTSLKKLEDEEVLLDQAFEYFLEKIDTEIIKIVQLEKVTDPTKKRKISNKIDEFRDVLLALKLIYVELDNEDDAYQVFETLNTRGKDLATTDLLKNHIARLLKEKNPQNDDVKIRWSYITENINAINLDGIDLDGFLYHYWLTMHDMVQRRDIFKKIKESVKNKISAKKLLDDLVAFSIIYRDIYDPTLHKWKNDELEIRNTLVAINRFRVRHPIPLIMTVLRKYRLKTLNKAELLEILNAIELFTFVNTNLMNARSSGGIAKMYAVHARAMSSANESVRRNKAIKDFVDKLSQKLPDPNAFNEKFIALKYSDNFPVQKKEIQYVLIKLFTWMFPAIPISNNEMSIEHIEPQSSKNFDKNIIASIGNLWFLKTEFNNALNNLPATKKLEKYKNSQLPCDQTLKDAVEWTDTEINKRTKELSEQFWKEIRTRFKTNNLKVKKSLSKTVVSPATKAKKEKVAISTQAEWPM